MRLPTRTADLRLLARTVRLVLAGPCYALGAVAAALAALVLFTVPQNWTLFVDLVVGGSLPLASRVSLLVELFPFVGEAYTTGQGAVLVLAAALSGVNVAMAVYHLREHRVSLRAGTGGLVGVVLGTLGAGCAACGTAILAGLFSFLGAAGLLTALPLEGLEVTVLAVVVIALSIWWLAEGMRGGEIRGCPVDPPR
ncbi:MAG: hypothetical protein ABEJ59_01450 [Halanaeroarchaeum sp.]